jgi:hypothetical protein
VGNVCDEESSDYLKGSRFKGEKFRKEYKSMKEQVEEMTREIQDSKFNIQ